MTVRLALGCPLAAREWSMETLVGGIKRQTVQPDYFRFVYTPTEDRTGELLGELFRGRSVGAVEVKEWKRPFYSREQRRDDPADPNRAKHFAAMRNALRLIFLKTDADVFISWDSDIMMDDPQTIERLVEALYVPERDGPRRPVGAFDVACAMTYLSPTAMACNAGWWVAGDQGDPQRVWRRADMNDVSARRSPIKADIPMACFAIRRHALGMCSYGQDVQHEAGEDLTFADKLDQFGLRVGWLTDVKARHVWGPEYLEATECLSA